MDAHNVVPVWAASDKLEVAARTIRKKIQTKLPGWNFFSRISLKFFFFDLLFFFFGRIFN